MRDFTQNDNNCQIEIGLGFLHWRLTLHIVSERCHHECVLLFELSNLSG